MTMQTTMKDREPPPARANGAPADPKPASALPVDLATVSDETLAAIAAGAQAETARRLEERRFAALAALREQAEAAQALGIPLARLKAHLDRKDDGTSTAATGWKAADGSNIGARAVVAPKYRKDPSQTWSGRGVQPQWVKDHLAAGGTMAELLIRE